MPSAGFKPTISAGKRAQTYALDHATTGISDTYLTKLNFITPITFGHDF